MVAERVEEKEMWIGGSRARGFPFVRIEPGHYGLVWQRCVPTEAQRLARLAEAKFTSRQLDAFEDQYGVWDPDGGLADGETLEASWDGEAWDDPDA